MNLLFNSPIKIWVGVSAVTQRRVSRSFALTHMGFLGFSGFVFHGHKRRSRVRSIAPRLVFGLSACTPVICLPSFDVNLNGVLKWTYWLFFLFFS